MAFSHTPPKIILLWMFTSTLLVLWDASYLLLRPRSMPGGDLYVFWKPYSLYAKVDLIYSREVFESKDGFPGAQAFLNLIESALNFTYLALWARGDGAAAVLVGLVGVVMTLSKTVLYFAIEYFSGWAHTGHNDIATLIPLYIIPNGPWIILPSYCVWWFGTTIVAGLNGKKVAIGAKKGL